NTRPSPRLTGASEMPRSREKAQASPIQISPAVGCSKPAIMRKVVVLPQPDGPKNVVKEPSSTSRSSWRTAGISTPANRLVTPLKLIVGISTSQTFRQVGLQ